MRVSGFLCSLRGLEPKDADVRGTSARRWLDGGVSNAICAGYRLVPGFPFRKMGKQDTWKTNRDRVPDNVQLFRNLSISGETF